MQGLQQKVEHDAPGDEQCSTYIDIVNPAKDPLFKRFKR